MNMLTRKLKIGTHSGYFHCDDALACFLILQLPNFSDAQIIRTRDLNKLNECDIVVDVGGVYDHSKKRYDHHQGGFNHTLHSLGGKDYHIKLSSAGLIYYHYGEKIISKLLSLDSKDPKVNIIFDKVYANFIKEIDAIDNGVLICSGTPAYEICTGISSRVSHLLPTWKEPTSESDLYERFLKAVEYVGKEFEDRVNFYGNVWYDAKDVVQRAITSRYDLDQCGSIIKLETSVPWSEHLYHLEKELQLENEIKFVIFEDISKTWCAQAVPICPRSFKLRLPFPMQWRSLNNETLSQISGIPDCIFVHTSGFIGGNSTFEGALAMSRKALELAKEENTK